MSAVGRTPRYSVHWFRSMLEKFGLRVTAPRLAVIQALERQQERFTFEGIVSASSAGRATVYRTMRLFDEVGVICRVSSEEGGDFYHVSPRVKHQHVICTGCGAVQELTGSEFDEALKASLDLKGYTALSIHVEAFGFCPACRSSRSVGA